MTKGWYVKKRIITMPNIVSIFLKAWIIGLSTLRCKLCIYIAFEYTPSWEKKGNRYVHIFTLGPNWRSSRWQGKLHLYPGGCCQIKILSTACKTRESRKRWHASSSPATTLGGQFEFKRDCQFKSFQIPPALLSGSKCRQVKFKRFSEC